MAGFECRLGVEKLLDLDDRVQQGLRPRWTAGDVDIDRDDLVDPLQRRIIVIKPAAARARSHAYDPAGFGHLVVDLFEDGGLFHRHGTGHDEQVSVPGGEAEHFGTETGDIVAAGRRGHEFDRAACRTENKGPQGGLAPPVDHRIHAGRDDGIAEHVEVFEASGRQIHRSIPARNAYTSPAMSIPRNANISISPNHPSSRRSSAQGKR